MLLNLSNKTKNRLLLPLVFFFFLLINLAVNGGHTDMSDGFRAFLNTENLALKGTFGYSVDQPTQIVTGEWFTKGVSLEVKLNKNAEQHFAKDLSQLQQTQNEEAIQEFTNNRENWIADWKQNHKNEFYDQVPLALPTMGAPFYLLALEWELNPLFIVPFFVNSIVIATICLVIFAFGSELFKSNRIGFVLSIIFGLTSFIWPYISTLYSRPLASLFVILCVYLIFYQNKKTGFNYAILAGLCLGLSLISQPDLIKISPIIAIYGLYQFRKNKKQIIAFILILLVMVSLVASINYYRTGSYADFGFPGSSNTIGSLNPITNPQMMENRLQNIDGLYGLLISPGKGIFVFFPLALLLPFSLFYLYKDNKSLAIVFISIIILVYLFAGTVSIWDKTGSMWGPHRYVLPILPFITLSLGSLISRFSSSVKMIVPFVVLGFAGFIANLLGNLSNVKLGYKYANSYDSISISKISDDVTSVLTWNPEYSQVSQAFKVLSNGYIEMRTNCSFDVYLYCNYGIQSIILMGILIAIIGVIILYLLELFPSRKIISN